MIFVFGWILELMLAAVEVTNFAVGAFHHYFGCVIFVRLLHFSIRMPVLSDSNVAMLVWV